MINQETNFRSARQVAPPPDPTAVRRWMAAA
jgi:hypothetical protein